MSSEVEVDSLRGGPVPPAVAGCESDPDDASAIPRGEPALLVVALPAHRLLLLALGHPALPGQAQDVGVAAEDRAMLHGCEHPCGCLQPGRVDVKRNKRNKKKNSQSFERVTIVMNTSPPRRGMALWRV